MNRTGEAGFSPAPTALVTTSSGFGCADLVRADEDLFTAILDSILQEDAAQLTA